MIIIDSYKYRKYLLDLFPATVAYSLRKLKTGQTRAIRVRRSSDNAEQDIGFVGNELDTTSLLSFCSAGNGFVTTWYDQSGSGYNVTQTTQANQPQIVSSGVVITENGKPAIQFDGSNDTLVNNSLFFIADTPNCQFIVCERGIGAITILPVGSTPTATVYEHVMLSLGAPYLDFQTSKYEHPSASTTFGSNLTQSVGSQLLLITIYNGSDKNTASNYNYWTNGSGLTTGNGGMLGYLYERFAIGGRSVQGTNIFNGKIQEVIIYNTDQTANRTAIESNINTHYTIY